MCGTAICLLLSKDAPSLPTPSSLSLLPDSVFPPTLSLPFLPFLPACLTAGQRVADEPLLHLFMECVEHFSPTALGHFCPNLVIGLKWMLSEI